MKKIFTLNSFPRLKKLRETQLLLPSEICIERAYLITEYLKKYDNIKDSGIIRRAKAISYFLSNKKPVFFDDNLLAGTTTSKQLGAPLYPEFFALTIWPELETISTRKKNPQILTPDEQKKLNFDIFPFWMDKSILEVARKKLPSQEPIELFEKLIYFISGKAGCISHTVPNYEKVLKLGLNNIIKEASQKKTLCKDDKEKYDFYTAVEIVLQGVIAYSNNLSKKANELSILEKNPQRKKELEELSQICKSVPANPASSFKEAINSIWISHIAVHAENINMAVSPGRLDQILYPYYKNDIENNNSSKITEKDVIELVGCLWLKLSDNVNMVPEVSEELFGGAGTVPAVTLGGVDSNGDDAVNDLTYMMLNATEILKIRDPNVNARYNYEKNSKEYRNRVCEVIANTKAVPAFHNDVADIKTLTNQGVSLPHARNFSVIGCVELAESGRGYQASSSIILNLVTPLLDTLKKDSFTSFNNFFSEYKTQLSHVISQAVILNETLGKAHQELLPTPLLSAMFEGPMESGKDLIFGGALYNSSGATHVGFADTVDSLCAVYTCVFKDSKYSYDYLKKSLNANFEGEYSKIGTYLKNSTPKYGSGDELSTKISKELIEFLYKTYQGYTNYRGGKYRPAFWTMTNHSGQGKIAGALPNGRIKGTPFASGITPVSGASKSLMDCLISVSSLNGDQIPGGEALNLKFGYLENSSDIEKLGAMIESYFKLGGLQVQFNIMDYAMLKDAREHPEKYPDLMVRVSGYSAYFKDLNDSMKEELITRAQFDIRSGNYNPD